MISKEYSGHQLRSIPSTCESAIPPPERFTPMSVTNTAALSTQAQSTRVRKAKTPHMMQRIKDTAGLGTVLWLIGYFASVLLFFSPFADIMGWILLAVFTPVTIAVAWWWFRARDLTLTYYAGVGTAWTVIAVVLDYLFIVLLFQATYYGPDVFVYYVLTFLIPVGVGLYLIRIRKEPVVKQG